MKAILHAVRNRPDPARCIMVSATMSKAVRRLIGESAGQGQVGSLGLQLSVGSRMGTHCVGRQRACCPRQLLWVHAQ